MHLVKLYFSSTFPIISSNFSLLTFLSIIFSFKLQPPALQKSILTAACNHVDDQSVYTEIFFCYGFFFIIPNSKFKLPGVTSTLILPRVKASLASDVINMVKSSSFTVKT